MTPRILPVAEWHRLKGTALEEAVPHLDPKTTQIIVVQDRGEIVACWAVMLVTHVEGVWIHERYRRRSVRIVRALFEGMYAVARTFGARVVWTGSDSPDVTRILEKGNRARRVPFDSYLMTVPQEDAPCPPSS
jgi:hypothetical protein